MNGHTHACVSPGSVATEPLYLYDSFVWEDAHMISQAVGQHEDYGPCVSVDTARAFVTSSVRYALHVQDDL